MVTSVPQDLCRNRSSEGESSRSSPFTPSPLGANVGSEGAAQAESLLSSPAARNCLRPLPALRTADLVSISEGLPQSVGRRSAKLTITAIGTVRV